MRHSVLRQHVLKGHYSSNLVHIGPADYRQHFQLVRSHALQCHVQRMVNMNVGEIFRTGKLN